MLCVVLALAGRALAQTPEQLEIFRNLTPEQQQAVLQQVATQQGGSAPVAVDSTRRPASGGTDSTSNNARPRTSDTEEAEPAIPVLAPEDTLLVQATLRTGQLESAERTRLEELAKLVGSRNPYQLDRNGQLNLPGFAPMALAGLTEQQATQRLVAEPALEGFAVTLLRLPLRRTGVQGLKPFGYELFGNAPDSSSSGTDLPVPVDYVVGPGDRFVVQLFGSQNRNIPLPVNRDGTINFPELGPIRVGGMTFNAARQAIELRVARQMSGVQASVSMGETRAINVWVTGDVRRPASYTVSGLATMTTALFASGGVKPIGSLRNIQLKRQGSVVRRLDLYDLLINGDTTDDAKLLPGDVIFIPPVGPTVSVDGEVKRPAVYELRDEASVADVVRIAGGFTPDADPGRASLTRVDAGSSRMVLDINLTQPAGGGQKVGNGDVLRIGRLRPQIDVGVVLEGFVHRPGPVAWRAGLRLTDVIGSVDELKPDADQHYILIRRESGPDRRISVLSADLAAALAAPASTANVSLVPRDRIIVFDLAPGRERIIQPLIEELKLQAGLARPTELVRVEGTVKVPGQYPLEPGMRVSDLLRAGGNLGPSAYGGSAELTRYRVGDDGVRRAELITVDLAALRRSDVGADLLLQSYDSLLVKETPDWSDQESVTLRGEVLFPGTYTIGKGETMRGVLKRAGGLTERAFQEGSVFTRTYLREEEQRQMNLQADRMRSDLASLSLQAANGGKTDASETLQAGQSLLAQLQSAKATGRLIIDLPAVLAGTGDTSDIALRNGDELIIPKQRQEVTVIGEVQNAASYQFLRELRRADYIAMSGGTTKKADRALIYVVRADGRTVPRRASWFASNRDASIKPGDTIIVPLDTERMPSLSLWQAVTQILYNVAVSVAAVNSF